MYSSINQNIIIDNTDIRCILTICLLFLKRIAVNNKRVTIVSGHYGSGKSTFSLNYAIYLRSKLDNIIYLADLDVINPYYRTREHADFLQSKNIKILGSYIYSKGSDLPAVSGDVLAIFDNKDSTGIIDLGGNGAGVLPLGNFKNHIVRKETEVLYVFNACREENETLKKALLNIEEVEYFLDMKIDAIVNNSHLMEYTNNTTLENGYRLAMEVAEKKNIYIKCNCVNKKIIDKACTFLNKNDIFSIGYDIKL